MKKWMILPLVIALTLSVMMVSAAGEEFPDGEFDESNEGTVEVLKDPEAIAGILGGHENGEAFIPDDADRAMVGTPPDRPKPVAYPYSAIAYMVVRAECGCSWTGNGFMIGKNILLTTAHCMVCTEHSQWAKNIVFYFGYRSSKKYLCKYSGKWTAWAGDLFKDAAYRIDYDYACVKLGKDVGEKTGWFGQFWSASDQELESEQMTVAGYLNGKMKQDTGKIRSRGPRHLTYSMEAVSGISGGPIFDSDYYAYGISIMDEGGTNVGYRLCDRVRDVYDKLNEPEKD